MTANNSGAPKEAPKKTKTPTAQKRGIQNEKKRLLNKSFKSKVRTAVTSFEKSVADKEEKDSLSPKLNKIYSLIDKGVKKGIYKPNKAARIKSLHSKQITTA